MAGMSSRRLTKAGTGDGFIRDPHWDTARLSYTVQAPAPAEAQAAFEALRDRIEAMAPPDSFWRAPAERLHVSVHILANARHDYDKDAYWAVAEAAALAELEQIERRAFAWRFDRLIAAPLGVIAAASPDPRLAALRHRLIARLPPPPRPHEPPYPLVHCTLLRYAAPAALPADFAARVAALPCGVDWRAERLDLLRNARYPSLHPRLLQTFTLEQA